MARNDDSQRDQGAPSRVYKASDVHKRRVDRKGRVKENPKAAKPESNQVLDAAAPSGGSADASELEPPAKPAVVITPEFGKRTQAQKEADDRWFAAMRDGGLPAIEVGEAKPAAVQPTDQLSTRGDLLSNVPSIEAGEGRQPADAGQQPAGPAQQSTAPVSPPQAEPPDQTPDIPSQDAGDPGAAAGRKPESSEHEPEVPDDSGPSRRRVAQPRVPRKGKAALIAVAVVAVIILVAAGAFAWNRWLRFDDHADMQGQWYVVGTTVPVSIDEGSIRLTDDVTYHYQINAQDKTIRYTFGPMEGQGRYWFSGDRQYLVITDGDKFTGTDTAIEDLIRMFQDASGTVAGVETKLPEGEGIIAFCREPDPEALAKQKAEAEQKKKAEEAARKEAERKAAEEAAAAAAAATAAAAADDEYYEEVAPEDAPPAEEAVSEEPSNETPPEGEGGE